MANESRRWLGRAWIESLEFRSGIDPTRLTAGRNHGRRHELGALVLEPGRASTSSVSVEFDLFDVSVWDQVMVVLAGRSAHVAAILDGDIDASLLSDLRAVGIELFPTAAEIHSSCSCDDWAEPCKHAAAVLYHLASDLDRDPLLLFGLRGLRRDEFTAMWERSRGIVEPPEVEDPPNAEVVWAGRSLDAVESEPLLAVPIELAGLLGAPAVETVPMPWEIRLGVDDPIDPARVDELALDATERAWSMLADGTTSGLVGTVHGDIARRATALVHSAELAVLASRTRQTTESLRSWAAAWALGGDEAVEVLADPRSRRTDQVMLAGGRDALVELGIPRRSVALNYDSLGMPGGIKLVVGADGRWYRLRSEAAARGRPETWHLDAAPSLDIEDLIRDDEK